MKQVLLTGGPWERNNRYQRLPLFWCVLGLNNQPVIVLASLVNKYYLLAIKIWHALKNVTIYNDTSSSILTYYNKPSKRNCHKHDSS